MLTVDEMVEAMRMRESLGLDPMRRGGDESPPASQIQVTRCRCTPHERAPAVRWRTALGGLASVCLTCRKPYEEE